MDPPDEWFREEMLDCIKKFNFPMVTSPWSHHIYCQSLFSFCRHFHARLKSNFDVVATDFAAYLVDSDNNKKEIRVDTEELYKGYLVGK